MDRRGDGIKLSKSLSGLPHVALELFDPGRGGELRVRERPEVRDEEPRAELVAFVRGNDPAPGCLVPALGAKDWSFTDCTSKA